ncbi:MAG: nuclear transport factor 2 family protein [Chlamydiales bacterium]|nr:nuclear transport factor 2 family protein [Chlamydiales bacterium]
MNDKNLASGVAYYEAMGRKDLSTIETYLHPDVRLISPLAEITGKENVLNSVTHFLDVFNTLTIRASCGNDNHVMLAYDLHCAAPFGLVRGAVLLTFKDGLIFQYELFYDARPFVSKKEEIFN